MAEKGESRFVVKTIQEWLLEPDLERCAKEFEDEAKALKEFDRNVKTSLSLSDGMLNRRITR